MTSHVMNTYGRLPFALSHGRGCRAKKMRPVLPGAVALAHQPQPGFMHKGGGLQGLPRSLTRHPVHHSIEAVDPLEKAVLGVQRQLVEGWIS